MSGSVNPVWDSVVEFPVRDFTKVIFGYGNIMQAVRSPLNNRKGTIISVILSFCHYESGLRKTRE